MQLNNYQKEVIDLLREILDVLKEKNTKKRRPRILTSEELVAQVQMLAKELGKTPTCKVFDKDPRTVCYGTALKRFGSWNNFLEAAGLEARQYSITNEELVAQVQMLAKELGRTPTCREFDKAARTAWYRTASNRFGSWNNFLEAAGLKVNAGPSHLSDEDLISHVQMLAKELGRTPTCREFDKATCKVREPSIRRHFGSWNNFLEAAGLKVNMTKKKM